MNKNRIHMTSYYELLWNLVRHICRYTMQWRNSENLFREKRQEHKIFKDENSIISNLFLYFFIHGPFGFSCSIRKFIKRIPGTTHPLIYFLPCYILVVGAPDSIIVDMIITTVIIFCMFVWIITRGVWMSDWDLLGFATRWNVSTSLIVPYIVQTLVQIHVRISIILHVPNGKRRTQSPRNSSIWRPISISYETVWMVF